MIEHMNVIDTLSDQISALLDLMMMAEEDVDIKSIKKASEMCLTIHDELMAEVDKIYNIFVWKSNKQESREVENE